MKMNLMIGFNYVHVLSISLKQLNQELFNPTNVSY